MTFDESLALALGYLERHFYTRYIFPIRRDAKFPPLVKDNLDGNASNDPKVVEAWARKWPGCNWGAAHRKSRIMVVDVDCNVAKGKVGQKTFDALDLDFGFPETEKTTTPSGGFHLIYTGEHVMALGENGIGKDIDSPNYTILAGCTIADGTSYVGNDADAVACPEWIYDTIKGAKAKVRIANAGEAVVELDQQANIDNAVAFLEEDAEPAIEGSNGDAITYKTAAYLSDLGISPGLALELMVEYYNPRCQPPWDRDDLEAKVTNAYNYSNLSKVGGKTAEADFADDPVEPIKPQGNKKKIKAEAKARKEAKAVEASRPDDPGRAKTRAAILKQWVWIVGMKRFINTAEPIGINERDIWDKTQFDSEFNCVLAPKSGSAAELLFRQGKGSIQKFYRPAFKPGQPRSLDDGQSFNMYREPDIIPAEGDVEWWNEHMAYLFPDDEQRNLVLNWMAWLLQNLAEKPKHALIVQGPTPGTGKSFIGKILTRILHPANVSIVPQNGLSSQFNAWALQCKLIVVEELRSVDRASVKENLHDIITEDVISVEKKGVDPLKIENCFAVFAMSNDDAALTLDNKDRRYLVVRTDVEPRSAGYYVTLYNRLKDPAAMAAVAYSLTTRDLGEYSGQQAAPMTSAKRDMQSASAQDLEVFMDEHRGEYPFNTRLITLDDVMTALPSRLVNKSSRLYGMIKSALKNSFDGEEMGQIRLPGNGQRVRLIAINGSANILRGQDPRTIGAIYEADQKAKGKGTELEEAETEFGVDNADDAE